MVDFEIRLLADAETGPEFAFTGWRGRLQLLSLSRKVR